MLFVLFFAITIEKYEPLSKNAYLFTFDQTLCMKAIIKNTLKYIKWNKPNVDLLLDAMLGVKHAKNEELLKASNSKGKKTKAKTNIWLNFSNLNLSLDIFFRFALFLHLYISINNLKAYDPWLPLHFILK